LDTETVGQSRKYFHEIGSFLINNMVTKLNRT
jgi:hypothetical protein